MSILLRGRFVAFALMIHGSAFAANVAAKKDGVPVLGEARKDAATLLELKKGEILDAKDREGMFWKVQLSDGRTGYVSVLAVQRQAEGGDTLQGALREASLQARAAVGDGDSARSRTAVMGVRGLDESKEVATAGGLRPDFRSVYEMEDLVIDPNKVQRIEQLVSLEIENVEVMREKKP